MSLNNATDSDVWAGDILRGDMTHGSLFSGIGGFELGAKWAGIETLWNCEIEPFNRAILKQHFPESKQYEDIRELSNPESVDIISGGFPCQDISIANVNAAGIKGGRSGLWSEMFRICRVIRPKYIVIENSPMLLVRGFEQVLCDLSEIGYNVEWQCLSGYNFGCNHKRERVYIIAYPSKERCKNTLEEGKFVFQVLPKSTPRQATIPMPLKRFNGNSDFTGVRMDDDFSKELDIKAIEAYGNAVMPVITKYLFECIKEFDQGRT